MDIGNGSSNNVSFNSDNITSTNIFIERYNINDLDENVDEKLKPILPSLMENLFDDNSSSTKQQQQKQEKASMIMNNNHRKQYKCGSLSNDDNNGNDKRNGKLIDHGRNRYNNHRQELVAGVDDNHSDKHSNRQFSQQQSKSNSSKVLPATSSFKCGTKVSSKQATKFKNHHAISHNNSNLSSTSIKDHNNVNRLANIFDDDKCANKFKSVSFSLSASKSNVPNSPRSKRLTTKPPLASKKIPSKQTEQPKLAKNSQIPRLQTDSILSTFSNMAFPISKLPSENIVSASDTFAISINANTDRNDNGRRSFPLTNSNSAFKPVSPYFLISKHSELFISY